MTTTHDHRNNDNGQPTEDGAHDQFDQFDHELDAMLRTWHRENAVVAQRGRDRLLSRLQPARVTAPKAPFSLVHALRRLVTAPALRAAASIALLVSIATIVLEHGATSAVAGVLLCPEGGRLEARNEEGQIVGPCPLEHTDVDAQIAGRFARITLQQRFKNPYAEKIEAVYTFPMSHRGAVDHLMMTVGDRVVVGTVKERAEARRTYEAAREQGYVAALLEQERPNIFTQSVANIEPGAEILVEISYVETVDVRDGVHEFVFPMTVAPRYIPGRPVSETIILPAELTHRHGVVLRGPSTLTLGQAGNTDALGTMAEGRLRGLLDQAMSIAYPGVKWWGTLDDEPLAVKAPEVWYPFQVEYRDGIKELGWLYVDGTGQLAGRWFYTDPARLSEMGLGFEPNTDRVPDASRITPQPVRPEQRAGHDISVSVHLATGGPAISFLESEHHDLVGDEAMTRLGWAPQSIEIELADNKTIPNRDFILRWGHATEGILPTQFSHFSAPNAFGDWSGGFFTLMLEPPARVDDSVIVPRELVFVLDSSGSMENFPIEKAKALIAKAIESMRPHDRFDIVSFNESADRLFGAPVAASDINKGRALQYIDQRHGGGGTEMKKAVLMALDRTGADRPVTDAAMLADLPADGRAVEVRVPVSAIENVDDPNAAQIRVRRDLAIAVSAAGGVTYGPADDELSLTGKWVTRDGRRVFDLESIEGHAGPDGDGVLRTRYVLFVTDGEIGNDDEVIRAVRECSNETRMYTIGIGSSPNRSVLDGMAKAGRGTADYLALEGDAGAVLDRFIKRIDRPVLTNIEITASPGFELLDTVPPLDAIPDLHDETPIIIHGRYTAPTNGTLTIRGLAAGARYENTVDVALAGPESNEETSGAVPTLWARAQVDEHMQREDRNAVVALGETFQIMTKHTSFVAVERSRMTIGGQSRLVAVPIEMPKGQSWPGTFGGSPDRGFIVREQLATLAEKVIELEDDSLGFYGKNLADRGVSVAGDLFGEARLGVAVAGAPALVESEIAMVDYKAGLNKARRYAEIGQYGYAQNEALVVRARLNQVAQQIDQVRYDAYVNINTAPVEVMQSIPHWYKMIADAESLMREIKVEADASHVRDVKRQLADASGTIQFPWQRGGREVTRGLTGGGIDESVTLGRLAAIEDTPLSARFDSGTRGRALFGDAMDSAVIKDADLSSFFFDVDNNPTDPVIYGGRGTVEQPQVQDLITRAESYGLQVQPNVNLVVPDTTLYLSTTATELGLEFTNAPQLDLNAAFGVDYDAITLDPPPESPGISPALLENMLEELGVATDNGTVPGQDMSALGDDDENGFVEFNDLLDELTKGFVTSPDKDERHAALVEAAAAFMDVKPPLPQPMQPDATEQQVNDWVGARRAVVAWEEEREKTVDRISRILEENESAQGERLEELATLAECLEAESVDDAALAAVLAVQVDEMVPVEVTMTPLASALAQAAALGPVPIAVDWLALDRLGLVPETPILVNLNGARRGAEALDRIAAACPMLLAEPLSWWREPARYVVSDRSGLEMSIAWVEAGDQLVPLDAALLSIANQIENGEIDAARVALDVVAPFAGRGDWWRELDDAVRRADPVARRTRARATTTAIRARLAERIAAHQAEVELRRVVDAELWPALFGQSDPDADAIEVTVLLENRGAVAKLGEQGLDVADIATGRPIVVGTIAPSSLRELARSGLVRRIEPTRFD